MPQWFWVADHLLIKFSSEIKHRINKNWEGKFKIYHKTHALLKPIIDYESICQSNSTSKGHKCRYDFKRRERERESMGRCMGRPDLETEELNVLGSHWTSS